MSDKKQFPRISELGIPINSMELQPGLDFRYVDAVILEAWLQHNVDKAVAEAEHKTLMDKIRNSTTASEI